MRHALAEAVDMKELVAKAYRGALSFPQAGRGLFLWAYDPKAYPDVPYDPAHARALLQATGWVLGAGGFRYKAGHRLDLLLDIQASTPGETIIATAIIQYERAVGAHVAMKEFNITQFVAPPREGGPIYGGKFDLALYPFVNGDDPDTTDQFACSNIPPRGYNKSRICDRRIDQLLAAGGATYDPIKRAAIYAKLEDALYQELPIELTYQSHEIDVFDSRLQGVSGSVDSVFWNVAHWRFAHGSSSQPPVGRGKLGRHRSGGE